MSERATGKMTGLREAGWDFFVGFAMGTANVIPGVSGGTMLFIMGAFEKLVGAIRQVASLETLRLLLRLGAESVTLRFSAVRRGGSAASRAETSGKLSPILNTSPRSGTGLSQQTNCWQSKAIKPASLKRRET